MEKLLRIPASRGPVGADSPDEARLAAAARSAASVPAGLREVGEQALLRGDAAEARRCFQELLELGRRRLCEGGEAGAEHAQILASLGLATFLCGDRQGAAGHWAAAERSLPADPCPATDALRRWLAAWATHRSCLGSDGPDARREGEG